ncbi:STY0301 family protein [Herbaspirillum sp. ST 5-3]|uniref:STY0301 family protein n=1 Tax=Oxalobacteraceae TaxID=75682 RepID=UPI0010A35FC1|nr:STY0301 family protein [Herbaspirillum sp. ST 5-3]
MKAIVLSCIFLASSLSAQTIECPKFYPSEDTHLTETPYNHSGKGIVRRAELKDASAFIGEINGGGELQGARKDVKGGYDVELPLNARWFVCEYGNDVQWWEELKLNPKITSCTMQVRQSKKLPMDAKLVCK